MQEVWRRLVVLTFSVLLLSGVRPAMHDLASGAASQIVAGSVGDRWVQSTDRHLRRHDGQRPAARHPRTFAPPPHVLPAAPPWMLGPAVELARLSSDDHTPRAITIDARRVQHARGPPVLVPLFV